MTAKMLHGEVELPNLPIVKNGFISERAKRASSVIVHVNRDLRYVQGFYSILQKKKKTYAMRMRVFFESSSASDGGNGLLCM